MFGFKLERLGMLGRFQTRKTGNVWLQIGKIGNVRKVSSKAGNVFIQINFQKSLGRRTFSWLRGHELVAGGTNKLSKGVETSDHPPSTRSIFSLSGNTDLRGLVPVPVEGDPGLGLWQVGGSVLQRVVVHKHHVLAPSLQLGEAHSLRAVVATQPVVRVQSKPTAILVVVEAVADDQSTLQLYHVQVQVLWQWSPVHHHPRRSCVLGRQREFDDLLALLGPNR